jgi:putative ABC transport system permease protein
MFYFKYLRRELSQRMRQAMLTALGLALGIGLVITVTATASGVRAAQGTVVRALYGIGTSLTVTKAPSDPSRARLAESCPRRR